MNIPIKAGLVCLCLMPSHTSPMAYAITFFVGIRNIVGRIMGEEKNDLAQKKKDAVEPKTVEERFIAAIENKNFSEIKKIYKEAEDEGPPLHLDEEYLFFKNKKTTPLMAIMGATDRHPDPEEERLLLDIVTFFIQNGADPTKESTYVTSGKTHLPLACATEGKPVLPLAAAIINSCSNIVKYLLSIEQVKATIHHKDKGGETPIYYAFYNYGIALRLSTIEIVKLLIESGGSCYIESFCIFMEVVESAIDLNDLDTLKKILDGNKQHYKTLTEDKIRLGLLKKNEILVNKDVSFILLRYGSADALDLFIRNGVLKLDTIKPCSFAQLYTNNRLWEILKYLKQYYLQTFNKIYENGIGISLRYNHQINLNSFIKSMIFMGVPPSLKKENKDNIISLLLAKFLREQERDGMDIDEGRLPHVKVIAHLTPFIKYSLHPDKDMFLACTFAFKKRIQKLQNAGLWRVLIPFLLSNPLDRPLLPVEYRACYQKPFSKKCVWKLHKQKTCCCFYYWNEVGKLWKEKIDINAIPPEIPAAIARELILAAELHKNFNIPSWLPQQLNELRLQNNLESKKNLIQLIDIQYSIK
jgi:hypothetical protein